MLCTQLEESPPTTPTSQYPMSNQSTSTTTSSQSLTTTSSCCDSGRPIITDPLTGQTVCSCQYDSQAQQHLLNYQRLASGLTPLNVYGSPYGEQSYVPLTAEQSAFYAPTDNLGTWPYPASVYYPYDPTLSGYPFANGYGVDLNGSRRKNATRETTSTLKAWLSEHRKNPYPTKGEKIMLAIITKMTLTQVSTWFANARRRLKKDNKVTWEPRNRVDDDDNDDAASDTNEREGLKGLGKHEKANENGMTSLCHKTNMLRTCDKMNGIHSKMMEMDDNDICLRGGAGGTIDMSQRDSMSSPESSILSDTHSSLQSPVLNESQGTMLTPSSLHDAQGNLLKPRIWSIVDTATSHNSSTSINNNNHVFNSNSNGLLHGVGFGVPTSGFHFSSVGGTLGNGSGVGGGGPAVRVSQQLARNLRLGYTSPYSKAVWLNGAFANMTAPSTSMTTSSSLPVVTTTTSAYSPLNSDSSDVTSPLSSGASTSQSLVKPTTLSLPSSTATSSCTYPPPPPPPPHHHHPSSSPMSIASSAHSTPTVNVNSTLFSRTYAQTIQNLTNLTKGLNHLMTPQINGSFMGTKTSPVQPDQRPELESSTS